MADYSVLSQGVRPMNVMGAIQGGQQVRAQNMLMQQQQAEMQREQQFNALMSDYLGQNTMNALGGVSTGPMAGPMAGPMSGAQYNVPGGGTMPVQPPPPDINQLYALDPRRAAALMQFQAMQQEVQRAQQMEASKQALAKAQWVRSSKDPGALVKTAFPEAWQQIIDLGDDPESFTPDEWRSRTDELIAFHASQLGMGPEGSGEQFTLSQGQTRFDAQGNTIASVEPAPSDKDPTDKLFSRANVLRDEFAVRTAPYRELLSSYETVKTLGQNGSPAGDIALIAAFMRAVDPGSRVTGAEQATAQNAGGVPAVIRGYYNRLIGEGELSEKQRADFLKQAGNLVEARSGAFKEVRKEYEDLANRAGVNPLDVVGIKQATPSSGARSADDFSTMSDEELRRIAAGG